MQAPAQAIHADDYRAFPRLLQGKARSRHHAEYAGWHRSACWNGRDFDRFPEFIVRAQSVSDIVHTIDFARSHRLSVSVRGSGHSYSGCFMRDSGILLDVSRLDAIEVDAAARRAAVQPGVTGLALSHALAGHGLAFPTGHSGRVGLGGFLLGGGLGINFRAWGGVSTFSVCAIDLIDAQGRMRHANPSQNPEFFWAARGGGPGLFFVVVKFYLQCRPMPACITSSSYRTPLARLAELLERIDQAEPDPSLEIMIAIAPDPTQQTDGTGLCALSSVLAFADSPGEAQRLQGSLRASLPADLLVPLAQDQASSVEDIYRQSDAMMRCRRYRSDNILTDRPGEAARILLAHLPSLPSPATVPLLVWRGEPELPDAAFSARGRFFLSTYAQWDSASDDEINRRWLAGLYDDLTDAASGCYINEFDLEGRSAQAHRCFSPAHWTGLRQLRSRFDPDGVFHDVFMP